MTKIHVAVITEHQNITQTW